MSTHWLLCVMIDASGVGTGSLLIVKNDRVMFVVGSAGKADVKEPRVAMMTRRAIKTVD